MLRLSNSQLAPVKAAILSKRQQGKCAICSTPISGSNACLDHDHSTGVIRGVLCRNCNGIEGKIKNLVIRGKRKHLPKDYLGKILLYWIYHEVDRTNLLHPLHLTADEKRLKTNEKARKARAKRKVK